MPRVRDTTDYLIKYEIILDKAQLWHTIGSNISNASPTFVQNLYFVSFIFFIFSRYRT